MSFTWNKRDLKRRRGAAAIEFAMLMPLMVVFAAAVIDFSWYVNRFYNIQQATRDAARIAATIYESKADAGTLSVPAAEAHAEAVLDGLGMRCLGSCQVNATYRNRGFRTITVEVTYPHTPLTGDLLGFYGVLGGNPGQNPIPQEIYSTFTMAVEIQ
jgi:Flp pilus assembly protein TadG